MSSQLEELSMDLINKILSNPDLPRDRIKNLKLNWTVVYGELMPNLDVQFYEEFKSVLDV